MSNVSVSVSDGVGVITLDDPARRNAIDAAMVAGIGEACGRLESSRDVRAIVITGADSCFCAGADIGVLESPDRSGLSAIYGAFLRVRDCALPTVAAVNGPAVGAGLNIALACDVIIAGESARFSSRFLQIGLHPGGGHTWLLQRLVGPQQAAAMVLLGQTLDGRAAAEAGLALRCVPDELLLAEAMELAAGRGDVATELAIATKRSLRATAELDFPAALELELDAQLHSTQQDAFRNWIDGWNAQRPGSTGSRSG